MYGPAHPALSTYKTQDLKKKKKRGVVCNADMGKAGDRCERRQARHTKETINDGWVIAAVVRNNNGNTYSGVPMGRPWNLGARSPPAFPPASVPRL